MGNYETWIAKEKAWMDEEQSKLMKKCVLGVMLVCPLVFAIIAIMAEPGNFSGVLTNILFGLGLGAFSSLIVYFCTKVNPPSKKFVKRIEGELAREVGEMDKEAFVNQMLSDDRREIEFKGLDRMSQDDGKVVITKDYAVQIGKTMATFRLVDLRKIEGIELTGEESAFRVRTSEIKANVEQILYNINFNYKAEWKSSAPEKVRFIFEDKQKRDEIARYIEKAL